MASVKPAYLVAATPDTLSPGSVGVGPAGGASSSNGYLGQYVQPQQITPQAQAFAPAQQYPRSAYPDSGGGGGGGGYAPPPAQYLPRGDDDRTLQNTIANAHIPPGAAAAAAPPSGAAPSPSPYAYAPGSEPSNMGSYTVMAAPVATRPGTSSAMVAPSSAGGGGGGSRFTEDWEAGQRASTVLDGAGSGSGDGASIQLPTRSNTLKKKSSLRRSVSLRRTGSRRSMKAGSVRSLALQSHSDSDESHNAFYCPVPTKGSPTDALANRFQAWRKILKDLIGYHREIQNHYEQRAKSVQKLSATLNNTSLPPGFITSGGLDDAVQALRSFHKQAVAEAVKAREIEDDVILALTGLRSDLSQKIKEIKNISGDFRNSVDKEMDATKRAVKSLQDVLGQAEVDTSMTTGRQDPYLLRLAVDRQLERQLQEENYLHQAFLNLEKSGRELESIVVGEIQKSYNAYAGILKREAATAWDTVEELRAGPVTMPKDQEWVTFIRDNEQFVDPDIPIRSFQFIHYPGQNHYACQEIRAGLLERKSKYLKSYTAGWYVLSPTHLHEFKSADKMQAPVMSLYLPEQKLGSHSTETASSSKFVLKGRQTGSLHRGHTWVFRAESYDTMMAWYEDIHALTEKTPQERDEYARGQHHTRSVSRSSQHTYSSDGFVNEEDDEPFAVNSAAAAPAVSAAPGVQGVQGVQGIQSIQHGPGGPGGPVDGQPQQYQQQAQQRRSPAPRRPSPGGRFPSDLQVNAQRGLELQAAGVIPLSPTSAAGSGSGESADFGALAAANAAPGSRQNRNSGRFTQQQLPQESQQPPSQQQYLYVDSQVPDGAPLAYRPEDATQGTRYYSGETLPRQETQDEYAYVSDARGYALQAFPDGRPVVADISTDSATTTPAVQPAPVVSPLTPVGTGALRQTDGTPRPDQLSRQKSEPVSVSDLHMPGDFPQGPSN